MSLEKKFTSTPVKLLHNLDRLKEIKGKKFRPVSIQLAPTDKCCLSCIFCSVKNREMNELKFEDACQAVLDLVELGAKSVEITGGGDPTLYPKINDLIVFCKHLGLRVGLITNGVKLKEKVNVEVLGLLDWLRISLNCLDYVQDISIPELSGSTTLGFSYVWNELTSKETLRKVQKYALDYGVDYVRVVPDCRNIGLIKKYEVEIKRYVKENPVFFFQTKDVSAPRRCWMGWLKPFVNSDGFVYHCSANPLIDLKFSEKHRICDINGIKKAWSKVKPFNSKFCGECFFREHNELVEDLLLEVAHESFI